MKTRNFIIALYEEYDVEKLFDNHGKMFVAIWENKIEGEPLIKEDASSGLQDGSREKKVLDTLNKQIGGFTSFRWKITLNTEKSTEYIMETQKVRQFIGVPIPELAYLYFKFDKFTWALYRHLNKKLC